MDSTGVFKVPLPVDNAEPTLSMSLPAENPAPSCQNCKKLIKYTRSRNAAFRTLVNAQRADYMKLHQHCLSVEEELRKEKSERGKVQQKYRQQLARSAMLEERLARVTGTLKTTAECATQTVSDVQSIDRPIFTVGPFSVCSVASPASSPGSLSVNASDSGFSEKSASPHLPQTLPKKRRKPAKKTVEKPVGDPLAETALPSVLLPVPKPKRKRPPPKPKQPPRAVSVAPVTASDTVEVDIDQLLGFEDVPPAAPVAQPESAPTVEAQVEAALASSSLVPPLPTSSPDISAPATGVAVSKKRKRPPAVKAVAPVVQSSEPVITVPNATSVPPKKRNVTKQKQQLVGSSVDVQQSSDSVSEVKYKQLMTAKPRKPRVSKKKILQTSEEASVCSEPSSGMIAGCLEGTKELSEDITLSATNETSLLLEMISEFTFDRPILSPPSPLGSEERVQQTENSMSCFDVEGFLRDIHKQFDVDHLHVLNLDGISQSGTVPCLNP